MADASQLQLSPYALFDPSQWSNPYSKFQSLALPAASYAGWPTDAMGNPIQAPQGMTINQTPQQPAPAPAAAAAAAAPQSGYDPAAQAARMAMINAGMNYNAALSGGRGQNAANSAYTDAMAQAQAMQYLGGQRQAAQPAATPQGAPQPGANTAGLTPQQYMALRANPGPVPTYGATVPQASPSAAPGAGVLQQFLQNWKPASSGPGSGFQQGFAAALKNRGY